MLEIVAQKLELRSTEIKNVILILLKYGIISKHELIKRSGLPEIHINRLLKELTIYLEPPSKYCILKENAKDKLLLEIKNFEILKNKSEIVNFLSRYSKDRPNPDRQLDQFTATIQTSARRAGLMAKNGDLLGRTVAILGDDDLNSLAIAVAGGAKRVTVFEKDPRLLTLVKKISSENNLAIELIHHDLFNEIPNLFSGKFDTIFSDPPYTPGGISMFLNRGIELMKSSLLSRFYLCYGNSDRARERELDIQKIIAEKGLLIKTKKYQFNFYHGAESIGSRSSLYLLDWTSKTKETKVAESKIYTYE